MAASSAAAASASVGGARSTGVHERTGARSHPAAVRAADPGQPRPELAGPRPARAPAPPTSGSLQGTPAQGGGQVHERESAATQARTHGHAARRIPFSTYDCFPLSPEFPGQKRFFQRASCFSLRALPFMLAWRVRR